MMIKLGAIVAAILGMWLLIGPFQPHITAGIQGVRTISTEDVVEVTTGVGETAANATLSRYLLYGDITEVASITSTDGGDVPVAAAWYDSSKYLEVSGLLASTTRDLTINYSAEDNPWVGPFWAVIIFGGLAGAILWGLWQDLKGKGGR